MVEFQGSHCSVSILALSFVYVAPDVLSYLPPLLAAAAAVTSISVTAVALSVVVEAAVSRFEEPVSPFRWRGFSLECVCLNYVVPKARSSMSFSAGRKRLEQRVRRWQAFSCNEPCYVTRWKAGLHTSTNNLCWLHVLHEQSP